MKGSCRLDENLLGICSVPGAGPGVPAKCNCQWVFLIELTRIWEEIEICRCRETTEILFRNVLRSFSAPGTSPGEL